jgi:hypothetical protein
MAMISFKLIIAFFFANVFRWLNWFDLFAITLTGIIHDDRRLV